MKIAVVKYNAGNIYSVDYALKRLGVEAIITSDKETLMSADKIIFPGVGEAATTMNYLRQHKLDEVIKNLKQTNPVITTITAVYPIPFSKINTGDFNKLLGKYNTCSIHLILQFYR